jgi:hypothetical protein
MASSRRLHLSNILLDGFKATRRSKEQLFSSITTRGLSLFVYLRPDLQHVLLSIAHAAPNLLKTLVLDN